MKSTLTSKYSRESLYDQNTELLQLKDAMIQKQRKEIDSLKEELREKNLNLMKSNDLENDHQQLKAEFDSLVKTFAELEQLAKAKDKLIELLQLQVDQLTVSRGNEIEEEKLLKLKEKETMDEEREGCNRIIKGLEKSNNDSQMKIMKLEDLLRQSQEQNMQLLLEVEELKQKKSKEVKEAKVIEKVNKKISEEDEALANAQALFISQKFKNFGVIK